ncbi:MAG: hypothetical protein JSV62_15655 [Promethearchaeota archaeon]|nr:MAG: hypothetical protein JSV62_15655 [Candidatus Lokiarchaeota archaeon]
MPESEELNRDKYRVIIYHGHIHILLKYEEIEENDDINEMKSHKDSIITEI